jgi:carboxylesterase type B
LKPDQLANIYRALLWYYPRHPFIHDPELNRDAFNEIVTDFGFGYHAELASRFQADAGNDVYFYRLGYLSAKAFEVVPPWMGVFHSADLPYAFQWPLLRKNRHAAFDCGLMFDLVDWTEFDIQYANYMADLWTNFAKFGNPTPSPVKAPGNNEPTVWPTFNTTTYHYLHMFEDVEVRTGYRSRNHALLYDFLNFLAGSPLPFASGDPGSPMPFASGHPGYESPAGQARRVIDTGEMEKRFNEFWTTAVRNKQNLNKIP